MRKELIDVGFQDDSWLELKLKVQLWSIAAHSGRQAGGKAVKLCNGNRFDSREFVSPFDAILSTIIKSFYNSKWNHQNVVKC